MHLAFFLSKYKGIHKKVSQFVISNFVNTIFSTLVIYSINKENFQCLNSVFNTNFALIHARFGHTSSYKLIHIEKYKLLVDCKYKCESCPIAKQAKNQFPMSDNVAQSLFELLHINLWGPYGVPSINGDKYSSLFWMIIQEPYGFIC